MERNDTPLGWLRKDGTLKYWGLALLDAQLRRYTLSSMNELNDVKAADWVIILSTIKGSTFMLQQVNSATSGLVKDWVWLN